MRDYIRLQPLGISGGTMAPLNHRLKNGYLSVGLKNPNGVKNHSIHRLVAKTFFKNPLNKPQVNHRNGKKDDCCVDNLEWATASENCLHASRVLNIKKGGKCGGKVRIVGISEDGKVVRFDSIAEAVRGGFSKNRLNAALNNCLSSYKDYRWFRL